MPRWNALPGLLVGLPMLLLVGTAAAQQASPAGDAEYIKMVMTAAPEQLVRDATIVRMEKGTMQTLKKGTMNLPA
jgi:hypothetical protein